ncbi:hypothetical protein [Treponema sp. J25]|uniref:hypothetical protein n=1 Tax=Treponema sp. J25 TaxID=2094121 RepID=UPI00104B6BB9|nr:hypothetical protein [Treponema sp. J25]TCW60324.1 hypothetical protein C5O22_12380 [Treponema sp. J25]
MKKKRWGFPAEGMEFLPGSPCGPFGQGERKGPEKKRKGTLLFGRENKEGWLGMVLMVTLLLFSSCVGVQSNITIRQDGSGTIQLVYQVSRMVESLGKLDGNERFLPFPVGKVDFERTVTRVPGLSLRSYNTRQDEKNITVLAELAFQNLDALRVFLDSTGRLVSFSDEADQKRLVIRLAPGPATTDPDIQNLVRSVFEGYEIGLTITTPTVPSYEGRGIGRGKVGTLSLSGLRLTFTAPTADILLAPEAVEYSLSWK